MIPGLTKAVVSDYLERSYGDSGDSIVSGRSFAGWYFQQVIWRTPLFLVKLALAVAFLAVAFLAVTGSGAR